MSHVRVNLAAQVQGVLPKSNGGTGSSIGVGNEMTIAPFVNDSGGTLSRTSLVARTSASGILQWTTTQGQGILGIVVGRYDAAGNFEDADPLVNETAAVCIGGRCKVLTTVSAARWKYLRASGTIGTAESNTTALAGTFGVVLYTIDAGHCEALINPVASIVATGATPISYATPAIVLGTAAAAGAASTVIRSDSTIVAFDATVPTTQAIGDAAATGSAAVATRRDHKHAMPAFGTGPAAVGTQANGSSADIARIDHVHATGAGTPTTAVFGDTAATGSGPAAAMTDHRHGMPNGAGPILIDDTHSTPLIFGDLLQNDDGDDLLYGD